MYGVSSSGKEAIGIAVDKMFDILAYGLLGGIPSLKNKGIPVCSHSALTLAHIFLQALNDKDPNPFERDVLRSILTSSYTYIQSLKNKTNANIVEGVDALVKEAKLRKTQVSSGQIAELISTEMAKAKSNLKLIAEAETTKTRNMAHTMDIAEKSKNAGIEDPTVFFVIVRDNKTCLEEKELIRTTTGIVPIGNVRIGDILKNPSTPSQKGGNRVISIEKKQKETIELDFGDRKVVCTKDHPILVRFDKILCFMEADRITEDHNVVLTQDLKSKGELKMISRAKNPREFMKKLGYSDAWDFWRENIDDMIKMAKETESRMPIMNKYGIGIAIWDQYVIHILKGYDKSIKFVGRSPNNNFNTTHARNKSISRKSVIEKEYSILGGDGWFIEQIRQGKNSATIAKENSFPVSFLRKKVGCLGLLSEIRSRGGKKNWEKNRKKITKLMKERGTLHFKSVSKPEMELGGELIKVFTDLKSNFAISKIKVDFFIPSLKLVVEYDGSGHNLRDRLIGNKTDRITNRTDYRRDKLIKSIGLKIFRIKAPKDKFDISSIVNSIKLFVSSESEFGTWQS